jgi:ubiquinone/menaquinone biosynthesis C-methylase UbiE
LNLADFYDAELARHDRHFRAAMKVKPRDNVLDIGCGAGMTSQDAARQAAEGQVLGIDISAEMLEAARSRCAKAGLSNLTFELGDAETYPFPLQHFDLCISSFGVMFFANPPAAFANIAKAMRPGARLVWMVWQSQDRNPWSASIRRALAPETAVAPAIPAAFSLGDPAVTTDLLKAAGFASIDFAAVNEPAFYGADVDAAFNAVTTLQFGGAGTATDAAKLRLRALLRDHLTPEGVLFDSAAWIITARRVPE